MPKAQVGFIAVQDRVCRASVTGSLRRLGWTIATYASGYHLVEGLRQAPELRFHPHLIESLAAFESPDLRVVLRGADDW